MLSPVHAERPNKKGFTLIELLVVIAIIATLAVVVFVALDPVRRFREARNSTRYTDVNTILTATHEYIVDNDGALPVMLDTAIGETSGLPGDTFNDGIDPDVIYGLGTAGGNCNMSAACNNTDATPVAGVPVWSDECVDLLAGPDAFTRYLQSVPVDGSATYSDALTGYAIEVDSEGLIVVYSCGSEDPDAGGPETYPEIQVAR